MPITPLAVPYAEIQGAMPKKKSATKYLDIVRKSAPLNRARGRAIEFLRSCLGTATQDQADRASEGETPECDSDADRDADGRE